MKNLTEDSPNTIEGSFTRDLVFSKFWLADGIKNTRRNSRYSTIVVLGSWYGSLALIFRICGISADRVLLIDTDPACIDFSSWLYRGDPRVRSILQDANLFKFGECKGPLLVVNTSCNDIKDKEWFDRIPAGSTVALQSRSDHESMSSFDRRYPMSRILYLGQRSMRDPEESYSRLTKIGLK